MSRKKEYGNLEFPGVLLHVHERVVRGAVAVPVDAHVAGHAWNVEYFKKHAYMIHFVLIELDMYVHYVMTA